MSTEYLDAFSRITLHTEYDNDGSYDCLNFEDDCKIVEDALQRLEAIDNLKEIEALNNNKSYVIYCINKHHFPFLFLKYCING